MTPDQYNAAQIQGGVLTAAHITALVKAWQAAHNLEVDGMAGPLTITSITLPKPAAAFKLRTPLPDLPDRRHAVCTSSFRPPDRTNHNGLDFFYPWAAGDEPHFIGDRGCAGTTTDEDGNRVPKRVVPYGTMAIAAADGIVQMAGPSPTGFRVWIDHGNGLRTGYFHLLDVSVGVGHVVHAGDPVGRVGDNPADHDGRHLHFELSPTETYAPVDPTPYLRA